MPVRRSASVAGRPDSADRAAPVDFGQLLSLIFLSEIGILGSRAALFGALALSKDRFRPMK